MARVTTFKSGVRSGLSQIHYVAAGDLELLIPELLPSMCWDYRHITGKCQNAWLYAVQEIKSRDLSMLGKYLLSYIP